MEPGGSLPHSQEPATSPYPEPVQSSPLSPIPLTEDAFYYYPLIYAQVFQMVLFLQVFSTKILYASLLSPIRATCPTHLILVDLITRIMICGIVMDILETYVLKRKFTEYV
jgi:hypothetical protein